MNVAYRQAHRDRDLLLQSLLALLDEVPVEGRFQTVILRLHLPPPHVMRYRRIVENR